jgi:hypothetical protein
VVRRLLPRASWPTAVGRLDLAVMSAAFLIFALSLIFQPSRWHATPAYHVLLLILPAQAWGALFLASGASMGASAWQFTRRWAVVASLVLAFTLTTGWALSFIVRYATSGSTTPETWVSWFVFDFLLVKVAVSLDRGPAVPPPGDGVAEFRQAVDDALTAAEQGQKAAVLRALDTEAGKRREAVSAALAAYGDALRAIVPLAAASSGDLAAEAITEARSALRRAEEAYQHATGQPAPPRDGP